MEGPEDAESTHTGLPYLLQRITRSLSGLGRAPANAARGFQHAFGLDDGYDSEEDEEISEALFREVRGCVAWVGGDVSGMGVVCGPCVETCCTS